MGMESQPQTAELAPFIHRQAPSPQPRMRGFQESPEHPAELVAVAQPLRKGPCFSHDRQPLHSQIPPPTTCPSGRLPPTLHTSLLPLRGRRPACVSLGAMVGTGPLQVAWPLRRGTGCRTAPHRPPWPRALTPFLCSSPSLPHCDRSSPPASGAFAIQLRARYRGQCAFLL